MHVDIYTYLCTVCTYVIFAQTIIFMFTFHCTSSAEIFCFKNRTSSASESDGNASFVITRTGSATDRSCIGYTVGDVSTQGMYSTNYVYVELLLILHHSVRHSFYGFTFLCRNGSLMYPVIIM